MISEDDYNYADERRIVVSIFEEFHEQDSPLSVLEFRLDGDVVEKPDEIPRAILSHLYGKNGYSLDERRSINECGASAAVHEISLAVVSGIAGGLATYLVGLVASWRGSQSDGNPSSEEFQVEQFLDVIKRSYKPLGELTVLEQGEDGDDFVAVVRDSSDTRFDCRASAKSGMISIKRGR